MKVGKWQVRGGGDVMNDSKASSPSQESRRVNAVALQNAVLCAECDVVSDSPHDRCLFCGSNSLFNIARLFGGKLPEKSAGVLTCGVVGIEPRAIVLQ